MVKADLCIPHKYLADKVEEEEEEEEEKRDLGNLQNAAIWREICSLPKTTESSISVQQQLVDLAGK